MLTAYLNDKLSALIPESAPFAIAFSGGGDSTALVHALKDHPQARYVYIVDHNLRHGSDAEAEAARRFAVECGYKSKVLKWLHSSPSSAIQEKARKARYGLMGDQCRQDRIKYLLTAHSEDDQAETLLMRYDRKTDWRGAAGMAELTYGPVWPELAMVNVVRPLLDITRHELRDYNHQKKINWTEDPSNENRDYTRIRARDYLSNHADVRDHLVSTAREMRIAVSQEKALLKKQADYLVSVNENGIIRLFSICYPELMRHVLTAASGESRIIDRKKIKRLLGAMKKEGFVSATLAGAMILKRSDEYLIFRDPAFAKGRFSREAEGRKKLTNGRMIWDGRYAISVGDGSVYISPNYVHDSDCSLRSPNKDQILAQLFKEKLPELVWISMPFLNIGKKAYPNTWIGHGGHKGTQVSCLVAERFFSSFGNFNKNFTSKPRDLIEEIRSIKHPQ